MHSSPGLKGKPKLMLTLCLLRRERRQRDTQEPNAFSDREDRFEKCVAELFEFASGRDLHLTGAASRDLLEVRKFYFECNRPAARAGALTIYPDLVDDLAERVPRGFVGEEIGGKRVLGTDRFSYPIGADGPLVDAARSPVIVGARFTEMPLQKGQGLRLRSSPVSIPSRAIFLAVAGPDAVKLPDR